ncbi:MAG: hypothetical protein Q8R47_04980 [Nanoarchaeota archaeon]|nr:hypothetical protein [Nanoarchaeota archaeon]
MRHSTFHNIIGGALLSAAVAGGIGTYFSYNGYNQKQEEIFEIEERMSHVLYNPDLENKSRELFIELQINKSNLFQGLFLTMFAAGVSASYFYVSNKWKQDEELNKQSQRCDQ